MSYDNQIDAYPLQMPQLDIHAIGAGGGSLIWTGADGTLQIGPQSAGAIPGPVCYGRGGTQPTISDANLILGRLPTQRPLSGGLMLDKDKAEAAFAGVAKKMGTSDIVGLAEGALRIAVAKMAGAVREVSVHRGYDPREFALVGFGGAGPMHIFHVAEELAVPRVMIPRFPGHLCALGQMLADIRRDAVIVWGGRLSALKIADLKERAGSMRQDAEGRLTAERHEETFGYAAVDNDVEIVNVRLVSLGLVQKPELAFKTARAGRPEVERRQVYFGAWTECPVLLRDSLEPGFRMHGPAVIEEAGGTSVIPPAWSIEVHESGALFGAYENAQAVRTPRVAAR
jgi:N-methylhydantoinase A